MNYPKYVSHKEVSAARIAAVDPGADGSLTIHLEGGYDNVVISHHDRKNKPHPEKGWYLVQYADGYISFSPASQFDAGYTLAQSGRISGSPQHLVDERIAREAAVQSDPTLSSTANPAGSTPATSDQASTPGTSANNAQSQKDDDGEDEDEEDEKETNEEHATTV